MKNEVHIKLHMQVCGYLTKASLLPDMRDYYSPSQKMQFEQH